MLKPKRLVSSVVLISLLLIAMTLIGRQYQANMHYVPINAQISRWADGVEHPTLEQWQSALSAIEVACRLQPNNADYILTKAKVLEWGWFLQYAKPEQLNELPQLYTLAQKLRPRWAQAYADEAWYWYFVAHNEQRSEQLLQKAYQLGPYVPEVLFRGLTVELQLWSTLQVEQRLRVFQKMKLLYPTDLRRRLVRLIQLNQQQKVACLYLRQQKDLPDWALRDINKQFCEGTR